MQEIIKTITFLLITTSLFGQDLSINVSELIDANKLDSAEVLNKKLLLNELKEDSFQFNNNQIHIHTLRKRFFEADSILKLQSDKISVKSTNYGKYIIEELRYRHYSSNDTNAISFYQEVIKDSLYFNREEYLEILYFTSMSLIRDNNYLDAKIYIYKAYYDPEIDNYPLVKAKIANALAVMHDKPSEQDTKIRYLKEVVKLGSERDKMTAYANMAVAYGQNMNNDSAMYFINRAIDSKKQLSGPYTGFFATRANIYMNMKDYKAAIDNYNLDYDNIDSANYKDLAVNRLNVGLAYKNRLGNPTLAIKFLKTAKNYASKTNNFVLRQYVRRQLADSYRKFNDFENAYSEAIQVGRLKDSIFNEKKLEISSELETKFKTLQKQAENEKLQQQNRLQKATLKTQRAYIIGGGGILLLLGFLASLFYRQRIKQEAYNTILQSQNLKIDMLKREAIHRTNNHLNLATNLLVVQKKMEQ